MSDIVEKTLASLPSLLGATWSPGKSDGPSRAFHGFIHCLNNIHKYEENQFIQREVSMQKQRLSQPGISPHQMREYLVRCLYCHVLGYDVSFAYIHAVKLAQQGSLLEKRAGYLIAGQFLQEGSDLIMLLINTIQKDLRSTNLLEVSMALTAATHLVSTDMIPAILPQVTELLKHSKEIIRKKTVLCLHKFQQRAPPLLSHMEPHFHAALCDHDPGVMWAALHIYSDLLKVDPSRHSGLVDILVPIMRQVMNRKLSADYEFHNVPAPWLQIHILKLLSQLGADDKSASEKMYGLLSEVLQRTEASHKIGLAVIYECLETIVHIYPQDQLVEHAAQCVGRFLAAKNNNLRYLGIKALSSVVRLNPAYAAINQEIVMECLDHTDQTIRTKTLDLLYRMTNPENVEVICGRLMDTLTQTQDDHLKLDLLNKIADLAERFAQSGAWYIDSMNRLLQTADDLVPANLHQKLISLIAQGTSEADEETSLCVHAVNEYWRLLQQTQLPNTLIQTAAWVLGEYSYLQTELGADSVVRLLLQWLSYDESVVTSVTRCWVVSAVTKIVLKGALLPDELQNLLNNVHTSDSDLQQRLIELRNLSCLPATDMTSLNGEVCNKAEFDFSLSFLDDYVSDALEHGGTPYKPHSLRHPQIIRQQETNSLFAGLKFASNDLVISANNAQSSSASDSNGLMGQSKCISIGETGSGHKSGTGESMLNLARVKRVWNKEGVLPLSPPLPDLTTDTKRAATLLGQSQTDAGEAIQEDSSSDQSMSKSSAKSTLANALFSGVGKNAPSSLHTSIFKKKTNIRDNVSHADLESPAVRDSERGAAVAKDSNVVLLKKPSSQIWSSKTMSKSSSSSSSTSLSSASAGREETLIQRGRSSQFWTKDMKQDARDGTNVDGSDNAVNRTVSDNVSLLRDRDSDNAGSMYHSAEPGSMYRDDTDFTGALYGGRPMSSYDFPQDYLPLTSPDGETVDLPPQIFHVDSELPSMYSQLHLEADGRTKSAHDQLSRKKDSEAALGPLDGNDFTLKNKAHLSSSEHQTNKTVDDHTLVKHESVIENLVNLEDNKILSKAEQEKSVLVGEGDGVSIRAETCQSDDDGDHMTLRLIVRKQSSAEVRGAELHLVCPQHTQMRLIQNNQCVAWSSSVTTPVEVGEQPVTVILIAVRSTSPVTRCDISGHLGWSDNHRVDVQISLPVTSFLRCYRVDVERFAELWRSCDDEARRQVRVRLADDEEEEGSEGGGDDEQRVIQRVRYLLQARGFFCIQNIGAEIIVASHSHQLGICLIHAKVIKSSVNLWIKSRQTGLSAAVFTCLHQAIEEGG